MEINKTKKSFLSILADLVSMCAKFWQTGLSPISFSIGFSSGLFNQFDKLCTISPPFSQTSKAALLEIKGKSIAISLNGEKKAFPPLSVIHLGSVYVWALQNTIIH